MIVMILEKVPTSLRGELTRWLIEPHPGVFVGHVNAMVRERLWIKCCKGKNVGGVVQIWTTNTEQRFQMRAVGAIFLDQDFHLVGRLSADTQPVIDPLAVQHGAGIGLVDHRVIVAQFFDHSAVARRASVHRTNAIEGSMGATQFLHTNTNCHRLQLL